VAALAAAVAAASGTAAAQQLTSPSGFRADFNGNSGSFKLYLVAVNGTTSNRFWNINYVSLSETDADGNALAPPRRVHNLQMNLSQGTSNVTMSGGNTSEYQWVRAEQALPAGVAQPGGGSVVVTHAMYVADVTVTGPQNQSVAVARNTLKISVQVDNWLFDAAGNKLALSIKMSDNGGGGGAAPNAGPSPAGGTTFLLPGDAGSGVAGAINLESTAFVDGNGTNALPVGLSQQGNTYTLLFPHFSQRVWYDPTVFATEQPAGGAATAAVGAAGVLAALCAVGAAALGGGAW
jgi:hypothetical protein